MPENKRKNKLRTASDVLSRLKWSGDDQEFNAQNTIVGYECRIHGPMEKSVEDFSGINNGGQIPEHRIQYFRKAGTKSGYGDLVFWDRIGRVDRLFGSGNSSNNAEISPVTLRNVDKAVATMKPFANDIYNFELCRNDDARSPMMVQDFMDLLYQDPHPARTIDYDVLIKGLQRAVKRRTVTAKRDKTGKLTIFNYIANTWGIFECLARGLVIDEGNRKIVATPFPKFFNHGEMTNSFPSGPFQAAEKMDGSLGVAFCYEALVLLGAYHGNGLEYSRDQLEALAAQVDMRLAKVCQEFESVEDVLRSAISLPGDKEGWVLKFPSSGYRMKIKGDEYCNLHRSVAQCTPLSVWSRMRGNEDLVAYQERIPEEFAADVKKIVGALEQRLEDDLDTVKAAVQATCHLSPKELGMLIPKSKNNKKDSTVETVTVPSAKPNEEPVAIPAWTLNFVFQSRKKGLKAMLEAIWDPSLADDGNILGFVRISLRESDLPTIA